MFYLRNVERKNRAEKDVAVADKDVAVAENVRLKRELKTLQKDLDRNRGSKYRIGRGDMKHLSVGCFLETSGRAVF